MTKIATHDYVTTAAGWCAGYWREKGATVVLTVEQAKYENVERSPAKTKAAPATHNPRAKRKPPVQKTDDK